MTAHSVGIWAQPWTRFPERQCLSISQENYADNRVGGASIEVSACLRLCTTIMPGNPSSSRETSTTMLVKGRKDTWRDQHLTFLVLSQVYNSQLLLSRPSHLCVQILIVIPQTILHTRYETGAWSIETREWQMLDYLESTSNSKAW